MTIEDHAAFILCKSINAPFLRSLELYSFAPKRSRSLGRLAAWPLGRLAMIIAGRALLRSRFSRIGGRHFSAARTARGYVAKGTLVGLVVSWTGDLCDCQGSSLRCWSQQMFDSFDQKYHWYHGSYITWVWCKVCAHIHVREVKPSTFEVGSSAYSWFLSQAVWGALDDAIGSHKSMLDQTDIDIDSS